MEKIRLFKNWRFCVDNLKPFLERFLSSLPVSPLTVLAFIALLIGVMMSFYTIPAESEGIVLRFGKFIDKVPSGLHTKLSEHLTLPRHFFTLPDFPFR
jgi:hypothetical protein